MDNKFDLRKFLIENRLTANSRLSEDWDSPEDYGYRVTEEEYLEEFNDFLKGYRSDIEEQLMGIQGIEYIHDVDKGDVQYVMDTAMDIAEKRIDSLMGHFNAEDAMRDIVHKVIKGNFSDPKKYLNKFKEFLEDYRSDIEEQLMDALYTYGVKEKDVKYVMDTAMDIAEKQIDSLMGHFNVEDAMIDIVDKIIKDDFGDPTEPVKRYEKTS